MGQFNGSLRESSGCGSSTIVPSAVRFFWGVGGALRREDEREPLGKEEVESRSGWCFMPRGSFLLEERRRMVPIPLDVRHRLRESKLEKGSPGTSSVSRSFKIPMVHFSLGVSL